MMSGQVLIPQEEKVVLFYGDELIAVRMEDGTVYIPVRRLCDNLGIDWSSQWRRIQRDEVLNEAAQGVVVTTTPHQGADQHGGRQEMTCLPLPLIPGWLFGVTTSRVREDIRDKLLRYRRECFDVLWEAFKPSILPPAELARPDAELTPAEQALALAEAVTAMARQQVALERWLGAHDSRLGVVEDEVEVLHGRLDRAAGVVGEHARRLRRLELTIAGGAAITDAQAAAISEAVKAVAFQLGKQETEGAAGRGAGNPYQRVYSELYRKFRVPSYRALSLESFPAVMAWLTEWWEQLSGEPAPFTSGADVGGQLVLREGE